MLLENSRVIITGGNGFIGSHVVNALVRERVAHITVLDRSPRPAVERVSRIRGMITYVPCDLSLVSHRTLVNLIHDADCIFHLAALKSTRSNSSDPDLVRNNLLSTLHICQAAAEARVKKLVFSSSMRVYSGYTRSVSEQSSLQPDSIYGLTKLAEESLIQYYAAQRRFRYVVARIFFVYGPGQEHTVIADNFSRIREGKQPLVYGRGVQAYDYVYIDDLVRALVTIMKRASNAEVYNIGSAQAVSIRDLVRDMITVSGVQVKIRYQPSASVQKSPVIADICKIGKRLHWKPLVSRLEGLRSMYRYYTR